MFGGMCESNTDGYVFTESGDPSDLYGGTRLSDHWFHHDGCSTI